MNTTETISHDNQRQAVLLGYLAGIIDGEGCLGIRKVTAPETLRQRKAERIGAVYSTYISVGMIDKRPLDLLQSYFGGSIREERVPDRRSIWRWAITSRPVALKMLTVLVPYLIVKQGQAEAIIKFCSVLPLSKGTEVIEGKKIYRTVSPQEIQRREEAYQAVRKLNFVGAAATTNRVDSREAEVIV